MKKRESVVAISLLFFSINVVWMSQVQAAPSCSNHELDWSQYPQFNNESPLIATATDIDGSTLDVSVTLPRASQDSVHVNDASTTFPGVVDQYMTNPQVYRHWKQNDAAVDTLVFNLSEDLTLNKFMFGGHRPSTLNLNFAYAELTFWDGPNGTGNKVTSKHSSGADSAVVLGTVGDATTAAINVLPLSTNTGAHYPSTFLSTDNSYTMVTYDPGEPPRPWTVLDMGGAVIRSMTWSLYGSSVDVSPQLSGSGSSGTGTRDLATARASAISMNISGYVGNFNFDLCEKVALGNIVFFDNGNGGGIENDGIQNGSEPVVPNVDVELYDSADTLVSNTTTNANGHYYFDNIEQGVYYVKIPASEFTAGQPLDGFVSSAGADNGITDDNKENGIDNADPATNGIKSNNFSLTDGQIPTGEDQSEYPGTLLDANVNATDDFGFVLEGTPPNTPPTGTQLPNAIPTLSEWAMIILMIMLGLVGYRHTIERQY